MTAPTIRPRTVFPASMEAERPYLFDLGLNYQRLIDADTGQHFEWVQSTANPDEGYVRKRSGGGNPWPDITTNPILNVRARAAVTFTALDTSETVDVADQTKNSVGTSGVDIVLTGLEPFMTYRFAATSSAASTEVNIIGATLGLTMDVTRSTAGAYSFIVNTFEDTEITLRLLKTGSGTTNFTGISFKQETYNYGNNPLLNLRSGTPGSLPRLGFGFGDNDSLGYNTLYVRLRDSELPFVQGATILWDETDLGNSEPWKYDAEWWYKSTSTGLAAWPDRYRKVVDRRLDGTTRDGELIDLAGVAPTASRGSPVVGNFCIDFLTPGTWTKCVRLTNSDGDYTEYEFDEITVAADTRPEFTVLSSGGEDYTTVLAAVAAAGTTAYRIKCLDGHTETSAIITLNTSETLIYADPGDTVTMRSETVVDPGGDHTFRVRSSFTAIVGIKGQPINNDGVKDPAYNFVDISTFNGTATPNGVDNFMIIDCELLKDNTVADDKGLYSALVWTNTSTTTYTPSRHVRGLGILNCKALEGFDDYFYRQQDSKLFDRNAVVIGSSLIISRTESCLRTTNDVANYNIHYNYIEEEEKDAIRLTVGEGAYVHGNRINGPCRIAISNAGVTRVRNIRWSGNFMDRQTTASGLSSIASTCCDAVWITSNTSKKALAADAPFENRQSNTNLDGLVGGDNPYAGNRGNWNVQSMHATAIVDVSSASYTDIRGNGTANTAYNFGHEQSGFIIQDGSGGAWTASSGFESAPGITRLGNKDKANYNLNQYFVPGTQQTTVDALQFVPYDMWRNRRTDQTVVGAAIADPPVMSSPPPSTPTPHSTRSVRDIRGIRRIR